MASLRELIVESEKKAEARLAEMRSLIRAMMEAMKRQPNVNKTIKDGLPSLVEQLEDLEDCHRPLKKARSILEGTRLDAAGCSTPGPSSGSPAALPPQSARKSGQKRAATSPPVPPTPETLKKKKGGSPTNEWTEVQSKKGEEKKKKQGGKAGQKNNQRVAPASGKPAPACANGGAAKKSAPMKLDAIVLKPAKGKSYADTLSTVRREVQPEAYGVDIASIRRTRAGEVLLELRKSSADSRAAFSAALKAATGEASSVRQLVPRASLEIRDLDSCSSKEEVEEAVRRALAGYEGYLQVGLTRPNTREQVTAIVTIDESGAKTLMQTARVKIGWVNCRIRRRVEVPRCFKCLGYGHQSTRCAGVDRGKACFRCGEEGHKAAQCKAGPLCFLCPAIEGEPDSRRHMAGSGQCGTFRAALAQAKR